MIHRFICILPVVTSALAAQTTARPHEQIAELDGASLAPISPHASLTDRNAHYAQIAASLPGTDRARFQLLHPAAP